jgi:hypothetical protein
MRQEHPNMEWPLFGINKKAMLEEAFTMEKKHFYLHAEFVYLIQNGHD